MGFGEEGLRGLNRVECDLGFVGNGCGAIESYARQTLRFLERSTPGLLMKCGKLIS